LASSIIPTWSSSLSPLLCKGSGKLELPTYFNN
jgi:hypothetical protein